MNNVRSTSGKFGMSLQGATDRYIGDYKTAVQKGIKAINDGTSCGAGYATPELTGKETGVT